MKVIDKIMKYVIIKKENLRRSGGQELKKKERKKHKGWI